MFYIGKKENNKIYLNTEDAARHIVALGSSGSGKTALCKTIIEEFVLNDLPVIAMDPQGDICSLLYSLTQEEAEQMDLDYEKVLQFKEKAQITVYTPGSPIGNEISLNPFHYEPGLSKFDQIAIRDRLAKLITALLGYKATLDKGKQIEKFLYLTLEIIDSENKQIENFSDFYQYLKANVHQLLDLDIIKNSELEKLIQKVRFLTIGVEQLLFNSPGFTINSLLSAPAGKVAVSIIYLNTLNSQEEKDYFTSNLASKLYSWMLQNPKPQPQLLFYFDEISPYLPAGNKKSLAKDDLLLLFRQARKYGVSCLVASQNIADLDYKGLSQFNTWIIGKTMTTQNLNKLKGIINSRCSDEQTKNILKKLTKLMPGEFLLIQNSTNIADFFKARWLYTKHQTMGADELEQFKRYYYKICANGEEFYYYLANVSEEQIKLVLENNGYQNVSVQRKEF